MGTPKITPKMTPNCMFFFEFINRSWYFSDRHRGGRNKGGRKIHSPMVTKCVFLSCGILGQQTKGGDGHESEGETREEGK